MSMNTMRPDAPTIGTSRSPGPPRGDTGDTVTSVYPKRRSDLRARDVDGELMMLDRQRQLVHQLNETAAYIWERCDGHHTVTAIADELAQAFDVTRETAHTDVAAAVREFAAAGLMETQSG